MGAVTQPARSSNAEICSQESCGTDWSALSRAAIRFARLWCDRRDDAEDTAQQALLALVRSHRPIRAPLDWLFIVTRRLAMRARHREKRLRAAIAERHAPADVAAVAAGRATALFLHTFATDPRVPVRDRRILIWTAFGYSHSEIARRLNCSRADVGQYVARARKRIITGRRQNARTGRSRDRARR